MKNLKTISFVLLIGLVLGFIVAKIYEKIFFTVGNGQLISEEEIIEKRKKLSQFTDSAKIFTKVSETVVPSVVSIKTNIDIGFFEEEFFGYKRDSSGSGFILDKEGHIVTNYHVIKNARRISVVLYNGEEFAAKFVGADKLLDVAILKISAKKDLLIPVVLGDSDKVEVGDMVLAIGCPMGWLEHSVTSGIISAKQRKTINLPGYEGFLQTDAAINPGNSGGPLVDLNGEVIGINTAIISPRAGYQGIGFAIPINSFKQVKDQLLEKGSVSRGFLGVQMLNINSSLINYLNETYGTDFSSLQELLNFLGLKSDKGVFIAGVVKNSPAHKAGIREGDVIIEFDNKTVNNRLDLSSFVFNTKPGSEVTLKIIRDKKEKTLKIRVGEREGE